MIAFTFIAPPLMLKENWTPIDVFAEAFKNEWSLTNKPAFFILIASIVSLATLYKRANSKKIKVESRRTAARLLKWLLVPLIIAILITGWINLTHIGNFILGICCAIVLVFMLGAVASDLGKPSEPVEYAYRDGYATRETGRIVNTYTGEVRYMSNLHDERKLPSGFVIADDFTKVDIDPGLKLHDAPLSKRFM